MKIHTRSPGCSAPNRMLAEIKKAAKECSQRILPLVLAASLANCYMELPEQPVLNEDVVPTGRYVEEQLDLPPEIQSVQMLEQAGDGALYLFGEIGSPAGTWGLWSSRDDGNSWSREEYAWIRELDGKQVRHVAMSGDKIFYILCWVPGGGAEWMDEDSAQADSGGEEEPGGQSSQEFFLAKAEAGSLEPISYPLPSGQYGSVMPAEMRVAKNGNLLLVHPFQIIYMDVETGEVLQDINEPSMMFFGGEAGERDGVLYLADAEKITCYDLATGRETGSIINSPRNYLPRDWISSGQREYGHRVLAVGKEDEAVYYCDDSGLYRTLPDSPVTELLLSGELSVLGMPTMILHRLIALPGDRYLILGENGAEGSVLYRYAYDPAISSEIATVLRVYSLYDNSTIRQAAGVFQRDIPTVRASFEVGFDERTGAMVEDVLRALSTEILAGAGPDVLVLDGMPVGSYIQKGLLLDLGEELDPLLQGGNYLGNVVEAYREEGGLYAVPARFTVPMLLAPEGAEHVTDIRSLADWLETQNSPKLKYTYPAALMEQAYNVEYNSLLRADGFLDEERYREFLQNTARLTGCEGIFDDQGGTYPIELNDDEENFVAWAGGLITAHVSELGSLYAASVAHQAMEERNGGTYHPMGDAYVPRTVLGVNGGGSQTDLAVQFVETALSSRVLSNDFRDGLPVHREALLNNTAKFSPNEFYVGYYIFWEPEDAELDVYWPDDSFFTELLEQLALLQTPVQSSAAVRSLVWEQSLLCLEGKQSPEEAARELKQKLDLHIAEQS